MLQNKKMFVIARAKKQMSKKTFEKIFWNKTNYICLWRRRWQYIQKYDGGQDVLVWKNPRDVLKAWLSLWYNQKRQFNLKDKDGVCLHNCNREWILQKSSLIAEDSDLHSSLEQTENNVFCLTWNCELFERCWSIPLRSLVF